MKIFYILFLFLICSCRTVLKSVYGIHQPGLEKVNNLNPYLYSLGTTDTLYSYFCNDTASLYKVFQISGGLPDIISFNSKGNSVSYKTHEKQCNGKVSEFLTKGNKLDSLDSEFPHYVFSLATFLNLMRPIHEVNLSTNTNKPVVIILWSKWIGQKLNKEKTISWVSEVKGSGKNYIIAFLNLDFLSEWGISKKDIPKFEYKN